jgi:hypothetical protein
MPLHLQILEYCAVLGAARADLRQPSAFHANTKNRAVLELPRYGPDATPKQPASGGSILHCRPAVSRLRRSAATPRGAGQEPSISARIHVKTLEDQEGAMADHSAFSNGIGAAA